MILYSDFPFRRARQMIADAAAILGIALFIVLGVIVHDAILSLQAIGARLADAGSGFESTMTEISDRLSQVPLIGSGIRGPFDEASGAGGTLNEVGLWQQQATEQLAVAAGLITAILPVVAILLCWLIPRMRFARRARLARDAAMSATGRDLLACRALSRRKLTLLLAAHPDPAGAWRRQDAAAIRALAALELRASGVRMS